MAQERINKFGFPGADDSVEDREEVVISLGRCRARGNELLDDVRGDSGISCDRGQRERVERLRPPALDLRHQRCIRASSDELVDSTEGAEDHCILERRECEVPIRNVDVEDVRHVLLVIRNLAEVLLGFFAFLLFLAASVVRGPVVFAAVAILVIVFIVLFLFVRLPFALVVVDVHLVLVLLLFLCALSRLFFLLRLLLIHSAPFQKLSHNLGKVELGSEVERSATVDDARGHPSACVDEIARDVNLFRKDRKLERGPADVVAAVEVESLLRDDLAHSSAVAENDRVEQLLGRCYIRLLRPLALVDGVEAPGDALTTRVLHDEPGPQSVRRAN